MTYCTEHLFGWEPTSTRRVESRCRGTFFLLSLATGFKLNYVLRDAQILLSSSMYPIWTVSIPLPPNTNIEYKFIRKETDGSVSVLLLLQGLELAVLTGLLSLDCLGE